MDSAENYNLFFNIIVLISAVVAAFITVRVTVVHVSKRVEMLEAKATQSESENNSLKTIIQSKVSYEHVENRYVTKEELNLHLKNVELQVKMSVDKTNEILEIVKELRNKND